jgi:hypothetical protein
VLELERDGPKNVEYRNPGYGSSNWFMPLRFHGEAEVEQHGPRPAQKKAAGAGAGSK